MKVKGCLLPKYLGILAVTLVLLLAGFAVWADAAMPTTDAADVYEEETVVVTATRTKQEESKAPGKTEVITKEEIEASGAATVAEVLADKGFVVSNYGGIFGSATVHLDGASAKQTLILVNGIPANTGCGGEVDLSYFPTTGVSRIEIAHGPLSSLYGANALGGVVNIITDLTSDVPINQATLTGGSNKYGQLGMSFQQQSFGIAFGGLISDGYRTYSEAKDRFLMGQYDFIQNGQDNLTLNFMYKAKDNQVPGSLSWPMHDDQFEETASLDLIGKHTFNDLAIEYKVFSQYLNLEYHDNSYSPPFYQHETNSIGADVAGVYVIENHEILGGLTVKKDDFDSTASGQHIRNSGAVFMQDNWRLHEKWQLVSGLRWDTGSVYSSPVCPKVNLNYLFTDNLVFKIGYGKAFRAPTIHELYWSGYGNPDLQPEYGERYDFTGEWRQNGQSVTMNVFYSDINNEISGITQAENYRTRTDGVNLNWQKSWHKHFITGVKYTWQNKKAWEETTQSYIRNNYYGKNRCTLNFGYEQDKFRSNLDWNWVAGRNDQKNDDQPDYAVLDWHIKYQVNDKLNYALTIANLTDKAYEVVAGYPMPGREYYLSANYSF
jgi:outer membrane cobalamin receptor